MSLKGLQTNPRLSKASPFYLGLSSNRATDAHTHSWKPRRVPVGRCGDGHKRVKKGQDEVRSAARWGPRPHTEQVCARQQRAQHQREPEAERPHRSPLLRERSTRRTGWAGAGPAATHRNSLPSLACETSPFSWGSTAILQNFPPQRMFSALYSLVTRTHGLFISCLCAGLSDWIDAPKMDQLRLPDGVKEGLNMLKTMLSLTLNRSPKFSKHDGWMDVW